MTKTIPPSLEKYDALTTDEEGRLTFAGLELMAEDEGKPIGFAGYLVPYYVLSDRGTFFVPNSGKKTAKERLSQAPHLYQHDTWEPIGKHLSALEDEKGFRIEVAINTDIARGAEVMSNLAFGVPMGLSVGMDRIADRSGTEADDNLLDRSTAPDYLKNVPINELRAITQWRWWEGSTVTFAAIKTARPDDVRLSAWDLAIPALTEALKDGQLSKEQLAQIEELAAAYQAFAADGDPTSTSEEMARLLNQKNALALDAARRAALAGIGVHL